MKWADEESSLRSRDQRERPGARIDGRQSQRSRPVKGGEPRSRGSQQLLLSRPALRACEFWLGGALRTGRLRTKVSSGRHKC